jgi:hypothetical protein
VRALGGARLRPPAIGALFLIIGVGHLSSLFNGKTALGLLSSILPSPHQTQDLHTQSLSCGSNADARVKYWRTSWGHSNSLTCFLLLSIVVQPSSLLEIRPYIVTVYARANWTMYSRFQMTQVITAQHICAVCFQFSFISSPLPLTRLVVFEMAILHLTCVLMRLQSMSMAFAMASAGPVA